MIDTPTLRDRIVALRQRLEQTPPLVPPAEPATILYPPREEYLDPIEPIQNRTEAGSRTQAVLEHSLRHLASVGTEPIRLPATLTHRARRLLKEAHELIVELRALSDEPTLAGPPPSSEGTADIDPLALTYRETAAMIEPAVRLAQGFPEEASIQLRLCDGLEGMLEAVRQRTVALRKALDIRREEAGRINTLAHLLTSLDAGQSLDPQAFVRLADELLEETAATPLRFLYTHPSHYRLTSAAPAFHRRRGLWPVIA